MKGPGVAKEKGGTEMIGAIQMLGVYAEALMATTFDVDMRDETGALSLQWAAVGAFVIFIAIIVAAIMSNKAQSQANNIPDVVNSP